MSLVDERALPTPEQGLDLARRAIQEKINQYRQTFNGTYAVTVPRDADWGLKSETITIPPIKLSGVPTMEVSKQMADSIHGILTSEGATEIEAALVAVSDGMAGCKITYRRKVTGSQRERREDRGGVGMVGGDHYKGKIDPWELQRVMKTSGNAFVDARRADALKYAWRMKGDTQKLLEDLRKAIHCLQAAIKELEGPAKTA